MEDEQKEAPDEKSAAEELPRRVRGASRPELDVPPMEKTLAALRRAGRTIQ